jgi:hypothetical protein
MPKMDRLFAFAGIAIGLVLSLYAYYSNSHPHAPKPNQLFYLLLFPASIGLMATENASPTTQAFMVAGVAAANGGYLALLSAILRGLFGLVRSGPDQSSGPQPE